MPPSRPRPHALVVLAVLWLAACAANRPVIYPDSRAAKGDIAECTRLARESGAGGGRGGDIARDAAVGAAMGGAATGVYGAVRGDADVAERAAAGAAAGASVGLIRGAVRASEPSPVYRRYVERCLRERGHDVLGWR